MSHLCRKDRAFSFRKLRAIIVRGEKMPVTIQRHYDGRMPESLLHRLRWQFEPAILAAIDAPTRIEVTKGVHSVFGRNHRFAVAVELRLSLGVEDWNGHTCTDLRRLKDALHDVRVIFDGADPGRKHQIALGAPQFPFTQGVDYEVANWKRSLASHRFGPPDGPETVGALAHM